MKPISYISYSLIALCVVLFVSCEKDTLREYRQLSDMDRQAVPYRLGDTVRFVDGSGNPVTLQVMSLEDGWKFVDESEYSDYFVYYEYRHIKLRSQDGAFNVAVRVQREELRSSSNRPSRIDVYLGEPSHWFVSLPVDDWHDSVAIGGRMYHDVGTVWHHKCYYNKTEGILQLRENDSTVILERLP